MWINTSRIIVFVSGAPATVIYEIGSATTHQEQKRDVCWIMEGNADEKYPKSKVMIKKKTTADMITEHFACFLKVFVLSIQVNMQFKGNNTAVDDDV